MRMIWLAEQKHRAERQACDAFSVPGSQEEEDYEGNYREGLYSNGAQAQGEKRHLMISRHIVTILR